MYVVLIRTDRYNVKSSTMKVQLLESLIRQFYFLLTLFVTTSCSSVDEKSSLKINNESIKNTVTNFIKRSNLAENNNQVILLSILAIEKDTSVYLKKSYPHKCDYYIGFEVINDYKVLVFTNLSSRNSIILSNRKKEDKPTLCDEVFTNSEYEFAYEEFYSLRMGRVVKPSSNIYIVP